MTPIATRDNIPDYLNQLGLLGRGAEIGVQRGNFSKVLLERWKGATLYLIDIWRPLPKSNDPANVPLHEQKDNLMATLDTIAPYDPRPVIIRDTSLSAASLFRDQSLDFVYIDAAHLYDDARQDILTWAPKITPGGLLMGHDYTYGDINVFDGYGHLTSTFRIEVKQAVDDWAAMSGKEVLATGEPGFKSWIIHM
jgi:hypothetical protein